MKPRIEHKLNEKQGHWILAKVGKRVLRPGGRELTEKLLGHLDIHSGDEVVEFAPGIGFTAGLACAKRPKSYIGVDNNEEAAALTRKNVKYDKMKMVIADATQTSLPDACATKVYGEAMLTMQPEKYKKAIIKEAVRLLKPGGFYGIHELGLQPEDIEDQVRKEVYKELSLHIRVHARPLTVKEWSLLLEEHGLKVIQVETNPMALLEPRRIIQDEGFFRFLKIRFNIAKNKEFRKRVKKMRSTFRKHENHMNAVAIVAQKQEP